MESRSGIRSCANEGAACSASRRQIAQVVAGERPALGRSHGGEHGEHAAVGPEHGHGREALLPLGQGIVRVAVEAGIAPDPFERDRLAGADHEAHQAHGGALPPLLLLVRGAVPERVGDRVVEQAVAAVRLDDVLDPLGGGPRGARRLPLGGDRLDGREQAARESPALPLLVVRPARRWSASGRRRCAAGRSGRPPAPAPG